MIFDKIENINKYPEIPTEIADFVKTTEAEDSEEDSRIEEAPQSKCIAELCAME